MAGTLHTTSSVESAGVLWTCRHRELSSEPLFTREECEACRRWLARTSVVPDGGFGVDDRSEASRGPLGRRRYPRATTIVEGGRRSDVLQTIVKGTAKLVMLTRSGRTVGLEVVGPGSPLGVESIVDYAPLAVSVVSLEDTTCTVAPRAAVLSVLNQRPLLVRELVSEAHDRLVSLMDRIAKLAGMRVEARFAHLFLSLAERFGHRENGRTLVGIPLLRQDLADFTGTALETSIRVMSRWEKQGVVRREGRGFLVDCRALERFC